MPRPLRAWSPGPWLIGLVVALVVLGPVLTPGSLLNLDLVVTPDTPMPAGVWGLGPELPRRLPFFIPIAWLSTLFDGTTVGKAVLLGTIVVAFVGMHRLAAGAVPLARVAAGIVYAAGPFLATRLAVGHLGTALAAAVLPWALPTLLRPGESLRRTLLWSAALGFCGVNGGILVALALLVGLVADRGRRIGGVLAAALVGQLPWLLPGLVVSIQGVSPGGADEFATQLDGPLGLLRLTAGQGFWYPDVEVGGGRLVVPLAGLALLVLAVAGRRSLPASWGGRAGALAIIGLVVAAASGVPLVDDAYQALADTGLGQPLREGHRVLPLFLVWLAPAAAFGASRLSRTPAIAGLVALGVALALLGPSLWGFGGHLDPVRLPAEWAEARRIVNADPGPVLALPWGQYIRPTILDGHLVHHPVPFFLGGDVLIPSGVDREGNAGERAEPREHIASEIAAALQAGESPDQDLATIGVRWVVLLTTFDAGYPDLREVATLRVAAEGDSLTLFEVRGHVGPAIDDEGRPVDIDPVIGPLATAEDQRGATWFRPGASGWLRGLERTTVTAEGNLGLPAAAGPLWYWPSLLVIAADIITVSAVVVAGRHNGGLRPTGVLRFLPTPRPRA